MPHTFTHTPLHLAPHTHTGWVGLFTPFPRGHYPHTTLHLHTHTHIDGSPHLCYYMVYYHGCPTRLLPHTLPDPGSDRTLSPLVTAFLALPFAPPWRTCAVIPVILFLPTDITPSLPPLPPFICYTLTVYPVLCLVVLPPHRTLGHYCPPFEPHLCLDSSHTCPTFPSLVGPSCCDIVLV